MVKIVKSGSSDHAHLSMQSWLDTSRTYNLVIQKYRSGIAAEDLVVRPVSIGYVVVITLLIPVLVFSDFTH